ncbi:hypothetical protein ACTGXS_10895, partial [Streptococcus suis]
PHFENAQRLTIAEVGFKKQLRVGQGGIMHRIVFPRRSNDPRTVPRDAVTLLPMSSHHDDFKRPFTLVSDNNDSRAQC